MKIKSIVSAQNCVIKFGGKEVGAIQNLKINSNNNVTRLSNIFGTYNQKFVRGTMEYSVQAEKAFIDMSSFYGGVNDFLDARNNLSSIADNVSDLTQDSLQLSDAGKVIDTVKNVADFLSTATKAGTNAFTNITKEIRRSINELTDPEKAKEDAEDILQGRKTPDDLIGNKTFDIEILSPIKSGFIVGSSDNSLWTLKDCKIVGRDIRIDVNNIILIEGLVLFARKLNEEYINTVSY